MEFLWPFGDETKTVTIRYNKPGSGGYSILLDSYNQCEVFRRESGWKAYPARRCQLTQQDIEIFTGIIDKNSAAFK